MQLSGEVQLEDGHSGRNNYDAPRKDNPMKLTTRFRPQLDAITLRELNDKAWQMKSDAYALTVPEIGETLAAHLDSLYPTDDMPILAKYGCVVTRDTAQVRIHFEGYYGESVSIPLGRSVQVASSYTGLIACAPRWSEYPNRGVSEDEAQAIKDGRSDIIKKSWEDFCRDQDARERFSVPRHLDSYFMGLLMARKDYRKDYKRIGEWPREYKHTHGKYPTWGEIAAEFPLVGELILQALSADKKDQSA